MKIKMGNYSIKLALVILAS